MKFPSFVPFVLGLAGINTAGASDVERRSLQRHTCELEVTMVSPTSLEIERCIGTPSLPQCTTTQDFHFTVTNVVTPAEEWVKLEFVSFFVDMENPAEVQQQPIADQLLPGESIQVTYSQAIPLNLQPGTYAAEVRVSGLSLADNTPCVGYTTITLVVSVPICNWEVSVEPTTLELDQCSSRDNDDPACMQTVDIELAFTNSGTAGEVVQVLYFVEYDDSQSTSISFPVWDYIQPGATLTKSGERGVDISAAGSHTREYRVTAKLPDGTLCEDVAATVEVTVAGSEVRRHRNLRHITTTTKSDGMTAAIETI